MSLSPSWHSRWPVLVWLLAVASSVAVISQTRFGGDLSAFLPSSPSPAQRLLVDQLKDGAISRLMLVGIEGAPPERLAALSRQLTDQLQKSEQFASIQNGEESRLIKDWEFLLSNRYLLSPSLDGKRFSEEGLREALSASLDLLASPAGALFEKVLPQDPTGEILRIQDNLGGGSQPALHDGVWFSPDLSRAIMIAQTTAAGFDMDDQERAIETIRTAFAKAAGKDSSAKLQLTGPGVFSVASRNAIRGDASRLSMIASVLVAGVLLFVYRSPRLLLLCFVPVVTGALVGIAAVRLVFGEVHGVTLGFGTTLIGEAVDYAVFLFTALSGQNPGSAAETRLWPTLRLGVLTSICGFSAMVFSGFPGLAQLGVFSVAGLIGAVLVTRFVLPIFVPARFNAKGVDTLVTRSVKVLRVAAWLRWALLAALVCLLAWLSWRGDSLWDSKLESLSPVSARDKKLDEVLRKDLGAPDLRHLIVIDAPTQQQALERVEALTPALEELVKNRALTGFDSPTALLPSDRTQIARQRAIPTPSALSERLAKTLTDMPYQVDLFAPFLREAEAARVGPLIKRSSLAGTALATKLDSLLLQRRDRWTALLPLRGVDDTAAIARAVSAAGRAYTLLDLKVETDRIYNQYRTRAETFALLGALAIVALLYVAMRDWGRVYRVLIPLAAAVIATMGILTLLGHRLTIFDLVALLLVVGVGSNYSLFFDRENTTPGDLPRTFLSLIICNVCAVIGFGVLAFSRTPVLNGIGLTVAIGALLSLIFSIVFTLRHPDQEASRGVR